MTESVKSRRVWLLILALAFVFSPGVQGQNIEVAVGSASTVAGSAGSIVVRSFANIPLSGFRLPIDFDDPEIFFDSVSFKQSILTSRFQKYVQWKPGPRELIVTITPDAYSPPPYFQPYDDEIFRIHYRVKSGVATRLVPVDTFFYEYHSGDLVFWDRVEVADTNGRTLYPAFSAGAITILAQTTDVEDDQSALPSAFALSQNFPNPFNPATTIPFAIPATALVNLEILDLSGRVVFAATPREYPAGRHTIELDGSGLASGVYFYRLTTPLGSQTRKMTLIK